MNVRISRVLGRDACSNTTLSRIRLDLLLGLGRMRTLYIAAGVTQEYLPEFMRFEGLEPLGLVSDIPQNDYDRFWEESFWGEFPKPIR